jgi:alpha-1,6-mannosyltransferase
MRVLDLDNNYSPTGGGVRTYHDQKIAWFNAHPRHSHALVIPSDRRERVRHGAVTLYHVPGVPLGRSGYRWVVRTRDVRRVIDDFAPDLIELGSPYVLPGLVRKALGRRSVPTVGFVHADIPDTIVRPLARRAGQALENPVTRSATRWTGRVYGAMTATFGASEFVLEKLADAGVRRLFHTPLGADTVVHAPERRDMEWRRGLGIGDDESVVLFLGRLAPEKGIDLLLESYARWRAPGRTRLVIGGHGPREDGVTALQSRFPEVIRLPYLSDREDVARAYASADVFLSLGAGETFSLATLEALVSGTPVVAPSTGGAGEQVSRWMPELAFEPGNPEALSGSIARALTHPRSERIELARRVAEGAGWEHVFDRHMRNYETILRAHRSGQLEQLEPPTGRWNRPEGP